MDEPETVEARVARAFTTGKMATPEGKRMFEFVQEFGSDVVDIDENGNIKRSIFADQPPISALSSFGQTEDSLSVVPQVDDIFRHAPSSALVWTKTGLVRWNAPSGTVTYNMLDEEERGAFIQRSIENGAHMRKDIEEAIAIARPLLSASRAWNG